MKPSSLCSVALASSLLLAGCGGSETPPAAIEAKWSSLYTTYLKNCASCHSPTGPGHTSDIEGTLDFTTQATGYTSVSGVASNLSGNQAACNGKKFVISGHPEQSLLLASLDSPTRTAYVNGTCDQDGITDETVKQGTAPSAEWIAALKQWIMDGAANN